MIWYFLDIKHMNHTPSYYLYDKIWYETHQVHDASWFTKEMNVQCTPTIPQKKCLVILFLGFQFQWLRIWMTWLNKHVWIYLSIPPEMEVQRMRLEIGKQCSFQIFSNYLKLGALKVFPWKNNFVHNFTWQWKTFMFEGNLWIELGIVLARWDYPRVWPGIRQNPHGLPPASRRRTRKAGEVSLVQGQARQGLTRCWDFHVPRRGQLGRIRKASPRLFVLIPLIYPVYSCIVILTLMPWSGTNLFLIFSEHIPALIPANWPMFMGKTY